MVKRTILCLFVSSLIASTLTADPARGLGINMPLAARLIGNGNVRFVTSIDVANHIGAPVQVDFYFDGSNLRTGAPITLTGSVTNEGLTEQAAGVLRARTSAYFEDFIQSLVNANFLPAAALTDGVLGSVMFVFNGLNRAGNASVTARFKNDFGGGTVGVALLGRTLTSGEPRQLVASIRDTRGNTRGDAQLYPNVFINNMGITPTGQPTSDQVTVELSAVSALSGQPIGTPMSVTINSGHTVSISAALTALQVPSFVDSILFYARVTAGSAAIQGIVSQVDNVTRDGSVFEMSRADF